MGSQIQTFSIFQFPGHEPLFLETYHEFLLEWTSFPEIGLADTTEICQ